MPPGNSPPPPHLQRPRSSVLKSGRDFISERCNLLFAFLTAATDCSVSGGQGQHFGYLCVHRAWYDAWHKIGSQNFCPGYVVNMEQCQTFSYKHPASDLTPGGGHYPLPLSAPSHQQISRLFSFGFGNWAEQRNKNQKVGGECGKLVREDREGDGERLRCEDREGRVLDLFHLMCSVCEGGIQEQCRISENCGRKQRKWSTR